MSRLSLRPDHRLTLLKGGEALFPALVRAIDAARSEVLLETYMFDFSRSVIPVAEALEQAGRRGVRVRVVVDGVGTVDIPVEWQARWREAGVDWRIFNPARGWRLLLPRRWRRLHRKLCVVDGRTAFCGGINLLDDHYDPNHGELDAPRLDFAVRVTGPLVADVHDTMTRLWWRLQLAHEARRFDFESALRAARRGPQDEVAPEEAPEASPPAASAALVLRDNVRNRRRIEDAYQDAIGRARREIVIANAYFIPGVKLQRALIGAARRGVRIILLLQGRYEYFMQFHASRAAYGPFLKAGIEIVEYDASFLHAKVAILDGEAGPLATVGSSNLDPLSLLLAREANVFVRDERFADELRGHLMQAIERHGRSVDAEQYARRPLRTRVLNWVAYGLMRVALALNGNRY
ncbi:MAG: cardiolipin synthase ClsB [Myxococcota bacterium]